MMKLSPGLIQAMLVLGYIAMIIVNACGGAGVGWFKGRTNGDISRKYDTQFTPDGWAFSIWGVIFLAMGAFTIYHLAPARRGEGAKGTLYSMGVPVAVNFFCNAAWGFAFATEEIWLSIIIMMGILFSLVVAYMRVREGSKTLYDNHSLPGSPPNPSLHWVLQYWLVEFPISLYLGWIAVATVANVSIWLLKIGVTGGGATWSVVMMVVASVLSALMLIRHLDVAYAGVAAWALGAIHTKQTDPAVHTAAMLLCILNALAAVGVLVFRVFLRRSRVQ